MNSTLSPEENKQIIPKKISFFQNFGIGAVAGTVEPIINHPFWAIKTRRQCGYSRTFNPLILYRGLGPNVALESALTATQMSFSNAFYQPSPGKEENETVAALNKMGPAFIGGALSSLFNVPTEIMMTRQQKIGGSFSQTLTKFISMQGYYPLFTGLQCTAIREGFFTFGYFALSPLLKEKIFATQQYSTGASFISGFVAGSFTTIISHPFDTIRAIQQDSIYDGIKINIRDTSKKICYTDGIFGFFKGIIGRGSRIASATAIVAEVSDYIKNQFKLF